MGFVEKVKNVISKLRAAGKTEKEVSEIIEQAARLAAVGKIRLRKMNGGRV